MPVITPTQLSTNQWQQLAQQHRARTQAWTQPYRKRRASGKIHPIYDFLFIYYRNAPAQLEAWHPGIHYTLETTEITAPFKAQHYSLTKGQLQVDPSKLTDSARHRLEMALRLCKQVNERPPQFGCFGMHEWAMVYSGADDGEIRHAESLPLRLSQAATNDFVRSRPINCSHFDAYRFFTPSAQPFNRQQPTKDTRIQNEQSGCLHTNMDLYKWSSQSMPWIGSELLWQSFELAIEARKIDMQASPYDCSSLGYAPIKVETTEGRIEYEQQQRTLMEAARPIRTKLIATLEAVLAA